MAIEPNAAGAPLLQGRIDEAHGRFDEALEATKRAARAFGRRPGAPPHRAHSAQALAGQRDDATAHLPNCSARRRAGRFA